MWKLKQALEEIHEEMEKHALHLHDLRNVPPESFKNRGKVTGRKLGGADYRDSSIGRQTNSFAEETRTMLEDTYREASPLLDAKGAVDPGLLFEVGMIRFFLRKYPPVADQVALVFSSRISNSGEAEISFLENWYKKFIERWFGQILKSTGDGSRRGFTFSMIRGHELFSSEAGFHLFHVPFAGMIPVEVKAFPAKPSGIPGSKAPKTDIRAMEHLSDSRDSEADLQNLLKGPGTESPGSMPRLIRTYCLPHEGTFKGTIVDHRTEMIFRSALSDVDTNMIFYGGLPSCDRLSSLEEPWKS